MEFMDLIEVTRVDNVKLDGKFDGSIRLTCHHLLFLSTRNEKVHEQWIRHASIDSVETRIREYKYQIILKCKNFQCFLFDLPTVSICQSVARSLEGLSNMVDEKAKYPFFNQPSLQIDPNDWSLYSIDHELASISASSSDWRISDVNNSFKVCPSYPKRVIVPKNADDNMLMKSSQFRAIGRFPVLSYFHKVNNSFIMRTSQPMVGTTNRRCKEDEVLLRMVLPMDKQGYIYDLRDASVLKSVASKSGGGFETESAYPLWRRVNKHMERHEQLHVSLNKLVDACFGEPSDKFLAKLEASGWFLNMRHAIYTACCIADEMHNKNACVLVHDWDGLDNTLLITSLVQILLNAECRTIRGFEALIEREWLQAGHPFSKRCFKSAYGTTQQKQEGPVFLLFLDCVRQIMEQFSLSFEFNDKLLVLLFDQAYCCEYGTFVGNCERDRDDLCVSVRTVSLWTYVNSSDMLDKWLNPFYDPRTQGIWPSVYPQSITLWSGLYLRFSRNDGPLNEAEEEMRKIIEANSAARVRVEKLKKELVVLHTEALERGLLK